MAVGPMTENVKPQGRFIRSSVTERMRRPDKGPSGPNPLFLAARLLVRLYDDANVIQAWVSLSSLSKGLDFVLASSCVTIRPMTEHVRPHVM